MNLTPLQRFLMSVTAQVGGIFLLLGLGLLPFFGEAKVGSGVKWIMYGMVATSVALILGLLLVYRRADKLSSMDHVAVDQAINIFLIFDIPVIMFLVCQEGGLCRSIFMPLFFLIPIALFMVEPPDRTKRFNVVLVIISACIVLSYVVSRYVGLPLESKIQAINLGFGRSLEMTYFCEDSHPQYDTSILLVSLLTILMPILQKYMARFAEVVVR